MNKRRFIKFGVAGLASAVSGAYILSTCFKPPLKDDNKSKFLSSENDNVADSQWSYVKLDPDITAGIAYQGHNEGGCMYGVFKSIVSQLEKKNSESNITFPYHMMKYGSGGVGNYGSVCGALNGAAAAIGLLVSNGTNRNNLISDLFFWYEKAELPVYMSENSKLNKSTTSVSNSVLCHASSTKWGKESGFKMNSKERSERCGCLVADVAKKAVDMLNGYFDEKYYTTDRSSEPVSNCKVCHVDGKLANIKGQMNCTSCHPKTLAHRVFGDIHYKIMD